MAAKGLKLAGAAALLVAVVGGVWLYRQGVFYAGPRGTWEQITVHGKSLEGSLEGNSPDRTVLVYLPPSYKAEPKRRYPVVYNLHGFTATARAWAQMLKWPYLLDRTFGSGDVHEMIMVAPDAMTAKRGSFYSTSVATGDWETFIARDLVAYIDGHYRTLPDAASRGLAGHSMGGYGAVRIGMRHPDVFSAIYALNACCLNPRDIDWPGVRESGAVNTPAEAAKASFETQAAIANAGAWSPNPAKPPLYIDKPVIDGIGQPDVLARWAANAPIATIDQYADNFRKLRGIGIDLARQDIDVKGSTDLHEALKARGIPHEFETYEGDHDNRIRQRYLSKVLPFFSARLVFEPAAP